ncbi:NAC transcription factor 32-like [Corylus avellana]|uniref:NAC transcription factor 32-like n=1 Tax=Corylus avellana TaxID=13451 RepID=UPI00286D1E48|nr:NAC transcription factor 32-like [Corylus avellana]
METEVMRKRKQREYDHAYLKGLPAGYRFYPNDKELFLNYLKPKLHNQLLPPNRIIDVKLSLYNPNSLAETYQRYGQKDLYIFSPTTRKYPNGTRPDRKAGNGFWKATGANKEIIDTENNSIIGFKKSLVFYEGKPPKGQKSPKGEKTDWIMQEYRLNNPPPRIRRGENDMILDEWVLCRIYRRVHANKSKNAEGQEEGEECVEDVEEEEAIPSLPCNSNGAPQQSQSQQVEEQPPTSFPCNSNGAPQQSQSQQVEEQLPTSFPCNSNGGPQQFRRIEQLPPLQQRRLYVSRESKTHIQKDEFTGTFTFNSTGAALQQAYWNSIGVPQPPTLQLPLPHVNRISKSKTHFQDVEKEVISAAPLPSNSNKDQVP